MNNIANMIDHTLLSPAAGAKEYQALCNEAVEYGFKTVCVPPRWVEFVAKLLSNHQSEVCTVVGFPLGYTFSDIKAIEATQAISLGASEIDMVIPIYLAKEKKWRELEADIHTVKVACTDHPLKVILETCLLTDEEIIHACKASVNAGADFVKTSTGFSKSGASLHAVKIMREVVGPDIGVKASGGIRDLESAQAMIAAGANRLGTSSGVSIIKGLKAAAGTY